MKKTGALFIVIDDTYNGTKKGNTDRKNTKANNGGSFVKQIIKNIAERSLCMIPTRLAERMVDEQGWILRNDIIWVKDNAMPENVNDRFSVDYEHIFFFTKNNKTLYWVNEKTGLNVRQKPPGVKGVEGTDWDWEQVEPEKNKKTPDTWVQRPDGTWWRKHNYWQGYSYYFAMQYEPYSEATLPQVGQKYNGQSQKDYESAKAQDASASKRRMIKSLDPRKGRIKRSVWHVNVKPSKDKHFAVYPVELVDIPMAACCPKEVCVKCGVPRVPLYDEERIATRPGRERKEDSKSGTVDDPNRGLHNSKLSRLREQIIRKPKMMSACTCNAGWKKGTALDIFMGSGTLAVAAIAAGVHWLGFELNPEYINFARRRITDFINARAHQKPKGVRAPKHKVAPPVPGTMATLDGFFEAVN